MIVKPAHMVVQLKPGTWVDPSRMQKQIKEAGFTPVPEQVELTVTGKVVKRDGGYALELDRMASPAVLPVSAQAGAMLDTLERKVGRSVELEARWQPDPAGAGKLTVTALREPADRTSSR